MRSACQESQFWLASPEIRRPKWQEPDRRRENTRDFPPSTPALSLILSFFCCFPYLVCSANMPFSVPQRLVFFTYIHTHDGTGFPAVQPRVRRTCCSPTRRSLALTRSRNAIMMVALRRELCLRLFRLSTSFCGHGSANDGNSRRMRTGLIDSIYYRRIGKLKPGPRVKFQPPSLDRHKRQRQFSKQLENSEEI